MKLGTRSKAVLAGTLALGLGCIAAPAMAQEERISFDLAETTFAEGDWGNGVEFTVSFDVPETLDIHVVDLEVSVQDAEGAGLVGFTEAEEQADGTWTGTVVPEAPPVAPDADGFPIYTANALFSWTDGVAAGEREPASAVELTITEDAAEHPAPDLSVSSDVFTTDSWGDGIEATLTLGEGVTPDDVYDVVFYLYEVTGEDFEVIAEDFLWGDEAQDGSYAITLQPEGAPAIAEDEDGPYYALSALYGIAEDGEWSFEDVLSNDVELFVIDPELDITGPSEASASELADGVDIALFGFQPEEPIEINYSIEGEIIHEDAAVAGINGRTAGVASIEGAAAGEVYTITASGAFGSVALEITVSGGIDAQDPTPPQQVDTGL
ncbi:MAG TPA: hypothetical protein H9830_09680 [Candidatus Agrococcus pullicola]|uniref:Uncharacterized protein n=1 Tax=Candidatus Agrococcus pullicola TaxID=2838429 RepID=A0A9D1YVK8_9MICO|nr:hypothetical protein [Candidatus Agrococcus pullicola]